MSDKAHPLDLEPIILAIEDGLATFSTGYVIALVAEISRLRAELAERDRHVCKTCNGRGWVMEYHSIDYGGGLGAGGASNSPCPEYKPPAVGLSAAPKEQP